MDIIPNGTKIKLGTVEGVTTKRGSKQNKEYTITGNSGLAVINGKTKDLTNFYSATDGKNNWVIWNVRGDWTEIGIYKVGGSRRCSYTRNFQINL